MKTLSRHCKHLESLCFLEPSTEASILEKDIFPIFFGIPPSTEHECSGSLLEKFASDKHFRESFEFQFPNLRKLDIDELFFDEDIISDIYTLTLLLQPKLMCFGKHTGLTSRIITNYRKIWSTVHNRPLCEATLHLAEARFVDSVSVLPSDGTLELNYWKEMAAMLEDLVSVELQKSLWNENEVAKFCWMFNKQVRTFSLGELPLSDMACLSNTTHLRLTLRNHYSFDKMHLILDSCPSLKTLSIHPTFYHEGARRNNRQQDQLHMLDPMMGDVGVIEGLMLAEMMGEIVNFDAVVMNLEGVGLNQNEELFPWGAPEIPQPEVGQQVLPDVRPPPSFGSSRTSKKAVVQHHNLTTLRIASLCEAGRKQSEVRFEVCWSVLVHTFHLCVQTFPTSLCIRNKMQ